VGAMDWIVEDDMVDGLFYTTFTCRSGGHTPFVQAGAETSDTGSEAVKGGERCTFLGSPLFWVPLAVLRVQIVLIFDEKLIIHSYNVLQNRS